MLAGPAIGSSARWPVLGPGVTYPGPTAIRRRARGLRDLISSDVAAVVPSALRSPARAEREVLHLVDRRAPRPDVPRHYRFLDTDKAGRPVTWLAAEPIDVIVNQTLAPANFAELVLQILSELAYFTHIHFRITGVGNLGVADFERSVADKNLTAPRVLVTFVATDDELESAVPAVATCKTWTTQDSTSSTRRNAGLIRCSAEARLPTGCVPNGWGAVLRHEAGHLVGLAHVEDPQQVMSIIGRQVADWGLGDRTALRLIGNAARGLDSPDAA